MFYVRYGVTIPENLYAILITEKYEPTVGEEVVILPDTTLSATVEFVLAGTFTI